jgi:hypothetical protein
LIHTVGVTRRAAAAVTLVVGLTGGVAGAATPSGLYGTVTKGPTQPVCRPNVACSGPAAGVTLTFRRNNGAGSGAHVRTSALGRYRIRLAPGVYTVRTNAKPFGVIPFPPRAWVATARFRRVDFEIDTGIR